MNNKKESITSVTISEILECLSGAEWALTDAVNRNRAGWIQDQARNEARDMLKRCSEIWPIEKL